MFGCGRFGKTHSFVVWVETHSRLTQRTLPVKFTHSRLLFVCLINSFLVGPIGTYAALAQTPADRIFTVDQLRSDFLLMRHALEEGHPALYRYQARDSANRAFDVIAAQLNRPMTESEFRRVIHPAITRIGCGHTSLEYSKPFAKWRKRHLTKPLPVTTFLAADNRLFITANNSTSAVAAPGSEILQINGQPVWVIQEQIYSHVSSDGYNETFKRLVANIRFDRYYRYVTGYEGDSLAVTLRDSFGNTHNALLRLKPAKKLKKDTTATPKPGQKLTKTAKVPKPKKRALTFSDRDSSVAVLTLNTFSGGGQNRFFRRSFRDLTQKPRIKTLVLDLRVNGGGSSDACIRLLRYLIAHPFQAYVEGDAPVRNVSFDKYVNQKFDRFIGRVFLTTKTPAGTYRRKGVGKVYKPITSTGFRGRILVLTSGNTFSAAAIVSSLLQQKERGRTTFIGRETGGGRYGCSAFVTPFLRLPETGVNLRFPLYKISLPVPGTDEGRGVMPDFPVQYTIRQVLAGKDLDLEKALELAKSPN